MRIATLIALSVLSISLTQCTRFLPGIDAPEGGTPTAQPEGTPGVATLTEGALVDVSEDDKVLGYPDQRKVAVDSQNRMYVAYRKQFRTRGTLAYHIFVARSEDGRNWTVLNNGEPIEQTGPYNQRVPAIAIVDDVIHVAWYGGDGSNAGSNQRQIKYAQSADGGASWSPWVNVAEISGYREPQRLWQEHPVLVADGSRLHIVWQGRDQQAPKRSQIRIVTSEDRGLSWSSPRIVRPEPNGGRSRPTLLIDPRDNAMSVLAYGENDGAQRIAMTQSRDGGRTWSVWRDIAPETRDQRHVSAMHDSRGRIHAVWRAGDEKSPSLIQYAVFDGQGWSAPESISVVGGVHQYFPSLAITRDDRIVLAWIEVSTASGFPEESFRTGTLRWVTARLPTTSWTAPEAMTLDEPVNFVSLSPHPQMPSRVEAVWSQPGEERVVRLKYATLYLR
jgi:hypothetical protein